MDKDKYHELEREFMFNDNKTMKKTIEIPVEIPEGHELIQEGNTYKIVEKKNKYPMELVTGLLKYYVHSSVTSEEESLVEKYLTFIALVETCKAWNKIDAIEADWRKTNQTKYIISFHYNNAEIVCLSYVSRALHFKDKETAELFLNTFEEEIELVKDLI